VTCLACKARLPRFERYGLPPRPGLCPRCGAKPRHRALLVFLRRWLRPRLREGGEVLDIGPSRPAARFVARRDTIGSARYTAVDLDRRSHHQRLRPPHRFRCMDAARLGFPARTFDVILCNNVLPFVLDDAAVLGEIRRCLKPDGVAMVDVAVELPHTTSTARLFGTGRFTTAYLANNGTQRFYGRDYPRRLRAAGLVPLRFDSLAGLSLRFRRAHGLKLDGRVYLAFGTPGAARAFARAATAT